MAEEMNHYDPHNPDVHHEESDINVRAVLIGSVIVVVLAVLMHVGLWGMYVLFRKIDRSLDPAASTAVIEPVSVGAGPDDFTVHWSEPAKYLEVIREEDRKVLEEYGWVNRAGGTVHVPVEVGMQMALERGYPTRQTPVQGTGRTDPDAPLASQQSRSESDSPSQQSPAEAPAESGAATGQGDPTQ